jgi:hypothetical protein
MMDKQECIAELAIDELQAVSGGRYLIGTRLTRGYIDNLKGYLDKPKLSDGLIANRFRGELPPAVVQKPRPWLNGHSIDTLTRPIQLR